MTLWCAQKHLSKSLLLHAGCLNPGGHYRSKCTSGRGRGALRLAKPALMDMAIATFSAWQLLVCIPAIRWKTNNRLLLHACCPSLAGP